jgi:glycosyltransferase involved in cell wall biosynthesis
VRVLVASHEWESASPGGAQRSAGALAEGLSAVDGVEVTLASSVRELPGGLRMLPDSGRGFAEALVESETDAARFAWTDPGHADNWARLLAEVRPDVVHLHHYYQVGLELPLVVRRLLPDAGIVMTLHEFLAICLQSGVMVDGLGHLCLSSDVVRCASCVSWPTELVAARSDVVRRGLSAVDLFLTPSRFVRRRYVDWGVDPDAIRTVENALELRRAGSGRRADAGGERPSAGLRIVYIGQHTPYKGLPVLLDAVARVRAIAPDALARVDVYGGGAERFGDAFEARLRRLVDDGAPVVQAHGTYRQEQLAAILDAADAIVVPSTWWENSPVVIEEALARRVPVICSDIGGMAEKVRDGVDGWHFQAGNAASLAERLVRLAAAPWPDLAAMRVPTGVPEVVDAHLAAYRDARATAARRAAGAPAAEVISPRQG